MHWAAWKSHYFLDTELKNLYDFIESTFPGEENLITEEQRVLCNPVFNVTVKKVNCHDREKGMPRYSSTKELVTKYLEMEASIKYRNSFTAMDVWLGA